MDRLSLDNLCKIESLQKFISLKLELLTLRLTLQVLYVILSSIVNTLDKCIPSALAFSSSVETVFLLPRWWKQQPYYRVHRLKANPQPQT